jgi:hypothetical protein
MRRTYKARSPWRLSLVCSHPLHLLGERVFARPQRIWDRTVRWNRTWPRVKQRQRLHKSPGVSRTSAPSAPARRTSVYCEVHIAERTSLDRQSPDATSVVSKAMAESSQRLSYYERESRPASHLTDNDEEMECATHCSAPPTNYPAIGRPAPADGSKAAACRPEHVRVATRGRSETATVDARTHLEYTLTAG